MISKERLDALALEVANKIPEFVWREGSYHECGVLEYEVITFAHALIKAVEKEAEVIDGWVQMPDGIVIRTDYPFKEDRKLITLPLVEGESE